MLRLASGLLAVLIVLGLCGCGGGSGGDSVGRTVAIQEFSVPAHPTEVRTEFFPKTASVPAGVNNGITWINQSPGRHQIVSGVLIAKGNPAVQHLVTLDNAGFSPDILNADFGDTIRINNLSDHNFTMQVLDSSGSVIRTITIPIGSMVTQPPTSVFPGPGLYTIQDPDSQHFATITLYGNPAPDGQFQSGIMSNGDIFKKAFPVSGDFPYFDSNPDDPTGDHIYATGTIVVQ